MLINRGGIVNKKELEKLISTLKIEKSEYWILSSASLVLRGIYDSAADLDLAVTEKFGEYYLQDIYDYYDFIKNSNREKDKKRIPLVKNYIKKIMDR